MQDQVLLVPAHRRLFLNKDYMARNLLQPHPLAMPLAPTLPQERAHLLLLEFLQECPVLFHTPTLLCTMDNINFTWVNTKVELVTTTLMVNLVGWLKVVLDINKSWDKAKVMERHTMTTSLIRPILITLVALVATKRIAAEAIEDATLITTTISTKINIILNTEAMVVNHTGWATETISTNVVDTVLEWLILTACSKVAQVTNQAATSKMTISKKERRAAEETIHCKAHLPT